MFLLVSYSYSQTALFQKDLNLRDESDGRAVAKTPNGNYLVAGQTKSSNSNPDIMVTKVDNNGNPLWSRTYEQSGIEKANDIIKKKWENNYLIAGYTTSYQPGNVEKKVLLMKISGSNGIILWQRGYDLAPNADHSDSKAYALTEVSKPVDVIGQRPDVRFVLTGGVRTRFNSHVNYSGFVLGVKGDTKNVAWGKSISESITEEAGVDIDRVGKRQFVVVGHISDGPHPFAALGDVDGNFEWARNYTNNGISWKATGVDYQQVISPGTNTPQDAERNVIAMVCQTPNDDMFVQRLDFDDGSVVGAQKYLRGTTGPSGDDIVITRQDGQMIIGGDYLFSGGNEKGYLLRTAFDFSILWEYTYDGPETLEQMILENNFITFAGSHNQNIVRTDRDGITSCENSVSTSTQNFSPNSFTHGFTGFSNTATINPSTLNELEMNDRTANLNTTTECLCQTGCFVPPHAGGTNLVDVRPNPTEGTIFISFKNQAVGGTIEIIRTSTGTVEQVIQITNQKSNPIREQLPQQGRSFRLRTTKGSMLDIDPVMKMK